MHLKMLFTTKMIVSFRLKIQKGSGSSSFQGWVAFITAPVYMVFDVDHVYHCVTQLSTALGHRRLFNGDTAYN